MDLAADGGIRRQPKRQTRLEAKQDTGRSPAAPGENPRTGDGRRWRAVRGHDVKDRNTDASPYGFPKR